MGIRASRRPQLATLRWKNLTLAQFPNGSEEAIRAWSPLPPSELESSRVCPATRDLEGSLPDQEASKA
jgi:hypothetical protein